VGETFSDTVERRIKEDELLVLPGVGILAGMGFLFSQWSSVQDDDVDFFDNYDSRRVDRVAGSAFANEDVKEEPAVVSGARQSGFYGRLLGGPKVERKADRRAKPSGSSRTRTRSSPANMSAAEGDPIARRDFISKTLGASALFAATAANADIDYAGVGYLGGAAQIDVNNANVRVYTKKPGMYPTIATKIVSNVPYKNKEDMYAKAKFTEEEAATVKKYDSQFIFLEPRAEYVIDIINNGLYR